MSNYKTFVSIKLILSNNYEINYLYRQIYLKVTHNEIFKGKNIYIY